MTAAHDLFDRILAEIRPEATVIPTPHRRRPPRRCVVPAVGAVAAAAVPDRRRRLGSDEPGPADARAAITGKSDPAVNGEAVLYGSTADGGTIRISRP